MVQHTTKTSEDVMLAIWSDDWLVLFTDGDSVVVRDADLNGLSEYLIVHKKKKVVMSVHRLNKGWEK